MSFGELFSRVGYQFSRAGNAAQNTFGGGVKTDPDEHDVWGVKKEKSKPASPARLAPPPGYFNGTIGPAPSGRQLPAAQGQKVVDTYSTSMKTFQDSLPRSVEQGYGIVPSGKAGGAAAIPGVVYNHVAPAVKPVVNEAVKAVTGGNQAGPAGSYSQLVEQMMRDKMARDRAIQARFDQTYQAVQGWENPKGPDSAQFQQVRSNALDGVTRRFNSLEAQAQGGLGPASQGARFGGLASLARGRAMGLADTEAQVSYQAMRDTQAFEDRKMGLLASLASSQREDPSGLALSLMGRQDARDAMDQEALTDLITAAPDIYKTLKELGLLG